eukprot:15455590-Alexandrium_andersonii.AAC.1
MLDRQADKLQEAPIAEARQARPTLYARKCSKEAIAAIWPSCPRRSKARHAATSSRSVRPTGKLH